MPPTIMYLEKYIHDFFRQLRDMLAEMPKVSELHPVPDAHVPVLGSHVGHAKRAWRHAEML
jgi:poly(A) polymerase Pap1